MSDINLFKMFGLKKASGDMEERMNKGWHYDQYLNSLHEIHSTADDIHTAKQEQDFSNVKSNQAYLQDHIKQANAHRAATGDDVYGWDRKVEREYGFPSHTPHFLADDGKEISFADSMKSTYGSALDGLDLEATDSGTDYA